MLSSLLALVLAVQPASAKRPPVHTACPWNGMLRVEDTRGDSLTVDGVKYKLSRRSHMSAFQQTLQVCGAQQAISPLVDWRAARGQVAARSAAAAAVATSTTIRAMSTDDEWERQQIIEEGAERAAELGAEIAALSADARVKRQVFMATLHASVDR